MSFTNTIFLILEEEAILKTTKTKPIVDAIKNRKKITFYYSGPRKGKQKVKSGKRVDAEAVAIGLSKRGNLIVRAYVQKPSVSLKGFDKTGWRTFMVSRMADVQISDETFDEKRPEYEEGPDKSMTVTYVRSDWTKKPKIKKTKAVKPAEPTPSKTTIEPTVEPSIDATTQKPQDTELPQPKPQTKPEKIVEPTKVQPEPMEPNQKTDELPQPDQTEKPAANPEEDEENKNLQESIKNIKRLMFL
jgi:hypothetical protein